MRVVHVDDALIVVDKPAGLLSVPGRGDDKQDCALRRVRTLHADAQVVHRLDMATSGLLVFARGPAAQRTLSIAFAERRVGKRYLAIVHGRPAPTAGEIALPLAADWPNRPRQQVDTDRGKPSLTRYRVLDPAGDAQAASPAVRSRVALEPLTGRSHQLRVHLAAIGHPIAGDTLYGPPGDAGEARLLLHAEWLQLPDPRGGAARAWHSPAPF